MPEGKTYEKFSSLIAKLADKYKGPVFSPHVTLIGDIRDDNVFYKAERLSKHMKPFTIKLTKATYVNDYYRCIIVMAEQTGYILNPAWKARDIFANYNKRKYIPHLSLFYGNLDEKKKKEIVNSLENVNSEFLVDKIHLVDATGKPENWNVIKTYPLT